MKRNWEEQHSDRKRQDKKTGIIIYKALGCQYCQDSGWRDEDAELICIYCNPQPAWKRYKDTEIAITEIKNTIPMNYWDKGLSSMSDWLSSLGNQMAIEQAHHYMGRISWGKPV
jgi:hypothetical protein